MSSKLTHDERRRAYQCRRLGYGIRDIARELGRAASSISREFRRNASLVSKHDDYLTQAAVAQAASHQRRVLGSKKKMRLKCPEIRGYVEHALKQGLSPELIAGRLSLDHQTLSISAEAIYQWLLTERADLRGYLLVAGKARRRRRSGKRKRLPQPAIPKVSIEKRPEQANQRSRVGDFEHDTIMSCRKGKAAILTIVDRKTRKVFLTKIPSLESAQCRTALIGRLEKVPQKHRHTLTSDNGSENADYAVIDNVLGTNSYFCHPYCAPERGSVENRNRAVRVYFPKGTNFDEIPDEYIEYAEQLLNDRPMKILRFKTPNEAWIEATAA